MTDRFLQELNRLIDSTPMKEHPKTIAFLKECRDRVSSVSDLEVELAYYRTLCEGYEAVLKGLGKGIIE